MRAAPLIAALVACAVGAAAHGAANKAAPPDLSRNGRPPQVNYMTECQGCHLPDGSGMAGRVPSMKGEVQHFLAVPGGREFLVRVPGAANSKLSDADLAALLNWLVPRFGGMPQTSFAPYTPQEVATYRAQRLIDVSATRRALVAAFPAATPAR